MTIKVPKQKIYVKIQTHSSIILGYIHIMTGGRVIDYINSQINRFIPVTEAVVHPLDNSSNADLKISGKNDVIILNIEDIEMLTSLEKTD
jgi:hypothetical protein